MEYFAFISYSHSDESWAKWLHGALERYRVPKRLVGRESRDGRVPAKLFPVFRDREELPGSSDLGSNISEALQNSRYLVVICSPRSAVSRWVNEEIATFKALGREDRVLCMIVDGEPNAAEKADSGLLECFAPALRVRVRPDRSLSDERVEPIAADVRDGKDTRDDALLKILAGLLGVRYDELRQRELRRRMQRRILAVTTSLAVALLLGGAWAWRDRMTQAESLAEEGRRELLAGRDLRAAVFLSAAYSLGAKDPASRFMLARAMEAVDRGVAVIPTSRAGSNWSPDGRYLVLGRPPSTVWDLQSGSIAFALDYPVSAGHIPHVRFSATKPRFWLAEGRNRATVWDLEKRVRIGSVESIGNVEHEVAFDADFGRAAVFRDGSARIIDLATGRTISTLKTEGGVIVGVWFAADGVHAHLQTDRTSHKVLDVLAIRNDYPFVERWNLQTGERQSEWTEALPAAGERVASFSADGSRVVTVTHDISRLRLRDAVDGREIAASASFSHAAGSDPVFGFAVKGTIWIAPADERQRSLRLFDTRTGAVVATLSDAGDSDDPLDHVAWADDGRTLLTSTRKGSVKLWAADGKLLQSFRGTRQYGRWKFSPDGTRILGDEFKQIFSVHSGRAISSSKEQTVAIIPDGTRVATRETLVGEVVVRDALSSAPLARFEGYQEMSPDGRYVLSDGRSGESTRLWRVTSAPLRMPIHTHGEGPYGFFSDGGVGDANVSQDGTRVATASLDGQVRLWSAADGKLLGTHHAHRKEAFVVVFSPDGSRVASAALDGSVAVWTPGVTPQAMLRIDHGSSIAGLAFDPSGTRLLSLGMNGSVKIWSTSTGAPLQGFEAHAGRAGSPQFRDSPQFSVDAKRFLTSGADGFARIWDATDGRLMRELKHGNGPVLARFTPSGKRVVSVDRHNTVQIWNAESGESIARAEGVAGASASTGLAGFGAFAVSDERILVNAATATRMRLLDSQNGNVVASIDNPDNTYMIALSPDRSMFATGHAGKRSLKFWDARNGKLLAQFAAHSDVTVAIRFSSDSETLVTAGAEGFAHIWRMNKETRSPEEIAARLRCIVPWQLSAGKLVAANLPPASCVRPMR